MRLGSTINNSIKPKPETVSETFAQPPTRIQISSIDFDCENKFNSHGQYLFLGHLANQIELEVQDLEVASFDSVSMASDQLELEEEHQ